jgi:hypothetical protein
MSDAKQDTPAAQLSPEQRVAELKARMRTLQGELRTLSGKLVNRSPEKAPAVQAENQELRRRLTQLETSLFALLTEGYKPRHAEDSKQQAEVLRLSAIEYFQQTQTDPELWKNIAF